MSNLNGKVAVVTGGSRDIGRSISIKLAKEGAKVVVNYFNSESGAMELKGFVDLTIFDETTELLDLCSHPRTKLAIPHSLSLILPHPLNRRFYVRHTVRSSSNNKAP